MMNISDYLRGLDKKYESLKPKPFNYKPRRPKEEVKDTFKTPAKAMSKIEISDELAFRSALSSYVKKCIGEELAGHMTYCSIKGNTLFIVFDHSASLHFYRAQEKAFLEKIRSYFKELKKEAPKAYWTKVRALLKHEFKIHSKPTPTQDYSIIESASGEFENHCKDEKLRAKFEQIRNAIKYNQQKQNAITKGLCVGEPVIIANLDKEFREPKNKDFRDRLDAKKKKPKILFLENKNI